MFTTDDEEAVDLVLIRDIPFPGPEDWVTFPEDVLRSVIRQWSLSESTSLVDARTIHEVLSPVELQGTLASPMSLSVQKTIADAVGLPRSPVNSFRARFDTWFAIFFAPVAAILAASSVSDLQPSVITRWCRKLNISSVDDPNRPATLFSALRGRPADVTECFAASESGVMSWLVAKGAAVAGEVFVTNVHIPLLLQLAPSIGELDEACEGAASRIPDPVFFTEPALPQRPACPKQRDLAVENSTFRHRCFQLTRPSQLIGGNLVALVDSQGVPSQVLQYRQHSLWSPSGNQEYSSIVSPVHALTADGLNTFAASHSVVWPCTPVAAAVRLVLSGPAPDLSTMVWAPSVQAPIVSGSLAAPASSTGLIPPPGTSSPSPSFPSGGGNSLFNLSPVVSTTFSSRDFGSSSQTQRDRAARAGSWLNFVKDIPGFDNLILTESLDIMGPFVAANVRARIPPKEYYGLPFLASVSMIFFLCFRYAAVFHTDMSVYGGYNLRHCLTPGSNFLTVDSLRWTWDLWAYCFDRVTCLSLEDRFWQSLIAPMCEQVVRNTSALMNPLWQYQELLK